MRAFGRVSEAHDRIECSADFVCQRILGSAACKAGGICLIDIAGTVAVASGLQGSIKATAPAADEAIGRGERIRGEDGVQIGRYTVKTVLRLIGLAALIGCKPVISGIGLSCKILNAEDGVAGFNEVLFLGLSVRGELQNHLPWIGGIGKEGAGSEQDLLSGVGIRTERDAVDSVEAAVAVLVIGVAAVKTDDIQESKGLGVPYMDGEGCPYAPGLSGEGISDKRTVDTAVMAGDVAQVAAVDADLSQYGSLQRGLYKAVGKRPVHIPAVGSDALQVIELMNGFNVFHANLRARRRVQESAHESANR